MPDGRLADNADGERRAPASVASDHPAEDVTRLLRQVSWLTGHSFRPIFPTPRGVSDIAGRRLAADSCGGSAGFTPASLLAPHDVACGDRNAISCISQFFGCQSVGAGSWKTSRKPGPRATSHWLARSASSLPAARLILQSQPTFEDALLERRFGSRSASGNNHCCVRPASDSHLRSIRPTWPRSLRHSAADSG